MNVFTLNQDFIKDSLGIAKAMIKKGIISNYNQILSGEVLIEFSANIIKSQNHTEVSFMATKTKRGELEIKKYNLIKTLVCNGKNIRADYLITD